MAEAAEGAVLNINVGILGHVDSGKTSLVRALSTELSTAALDKHPQSQERGITLDLGFSAFLTPLPAHLEGRGFSRLQFTLVDCPGHASLIRTIIGGAQIIDMMILVIDVVKGIQTQTAECLVIGEITTDNLIVVLNKVDMLPVEGREGALARVSAKIKKVLASTKFGAAPMIALSAAPGGGGKLGAAAPLETGPLTQSASVSGLVSLLSASVRIPERVPGGPFFFAIDHCFPIKGQGTVLTGTVLSGTLRANDTIELPSLRQDRKVKSMQVFKKSVNRVGQGDRAGLCVAGLDPTLIERGLAATPGSVPTVNSALALVKRIRFFKGTIASEARVHLSAGHATVMATVVFFGARELAVRGVGAAGRGVEAFAAADADAEASELVDSFSGQTSAAPAHSGGKAAQNAAAAAAGLREAASKRSAARGIPSLSYDWSLDAKSGLPVSEWDWQEELLGGRVAPAAAGAGEELVMEWQWAALLFDTPLVTPLGSLVIGSRLDADLTANACRLAFYGRLAEALPSPDVHELSRLRLYKRKTREGVVDKVESKPEAGQSGPIVLLSRGLFSKETDMAAFVGLTVHTRAGQAGVIDGAFGKSGKVRITFATPGLVDPVAAALGAGKVPSELGLPGRPGQAPPVALPPSTGAIRHGEPLYLRFRKYQFEDKEGKKALLQ